LGLNLSEYRHYLTGTSIVLSAWITNPLTINASSDPIGVTISHILFAISTFGYIITLISIWERREVLYNFGDGPGWVAFTFPFANTAIAAGLYQDLCISRYSYALSVWVLFISAIAAFNIILVDILYLWKGFYCYQAIGSNLKDLIPPVDPVASTDEDETA
jgi:tellurite resistance protein TehA-like permease